MQPTLAGGASLSALRPPPAGSLTRCGQPENAALQTPAHHPASSSLRGRVPARVTPGPLRRIFPPPGSPPAAAGKREGVGAWHLRGPPRCVQHPALRTAPAAASGAPPRSRGPAAASRGDPAGYVRVPAAETWPPGCPRSRGRRGSGWRAPGTPPCRPASSRSRASGSGRPGSAQALGSDATASP